MTRTPTQTEQATWDPDTLATTIPTGTTLIYAGNGVIAYGRTGQVGGGPVVTEQVSQPILARPADTPPLQQRDLVKVTASRNPALVGRVFRVDVEPEFSFTRTRVAYLTGLETGDPLASTA